MKRIFWTTIFWIAAVALLRTYARLFDTDIAKNIANVRWSQEEITESLSGACPTCPVCLQAAGDSQSGGAQEEIKSEAKQEKSELKSDVKSEVKTPEDDKLSSIQKQLDTLTKKLEERQSGASNILNATKEIRLFLGDEKTPNAVITVSGARVEMGE